MENRIPPPLITLLSILLALGVSRLTPGLATALPGANWLALLILIAGLAVCLAGVIGFRQAKTTVNPLTPEKASSLVNGGIYRYSRNPMYLGFLLCVIAAGLYLQHLLALIIGSVVFYAYINRFQIAPEERALTKVFGEEFTLYCGQVRRWL
jgi:protein-S-isoprenylcysteine O-methyltransferase Ste14